MMSRISSYLVIVILLIHVAIVSAQQQQTNQSTTSIISPVNPNGSPTPPSYYRIGHSIQFSDCTTTGCNNLPESSSREFVQNTTKPEFFITSSPLGIGLLRVTFEVDGDDLGNDGFVPVPCSAETGRILPYHVRVEKNTRNVDDVVVTTEAPATTTSAETTTSNNYNETTFISTSTTDASGTTTATIITTTADASTTTAETTTPLSTTAEDANFTGMDNASATSANETNMTSSSTTTSTETITTTSTSTTTTSSPSSPTPTPSTKTITTTTTKRFITTILPLYPSCFLNVSARNQQQQSNSNNNATTWLPRDKWCSLGNSNQQLASVKGDVFDFVKQVQNFLSSSAPVRASLPPEYLERINQFPELQNQQTRESNNILLAANRLSDLAICGSLVNNNDDGVSTTAATNSNNIDKLNSVKVSYDVYTLKKRVSTLETGAISYSYESHLYSELSGNLTSANATTDSSANDDNGILVRPGLPAKLDLPRKRKTATTIATSEASSSNPESSWCSSSQQQQETEEIKLSLDSPLTSTSLEMQVTDSWGNPLMSDSEGNAVPSSSSTPGLSAQISEILSSIQLSVSVTSSSMNNFPSSAGGSNNSNTNSGIYTSSSASSSSFDQITSDIFCIAENRHLWNFNISTGTIRITGFRVSLCPGIADKLLSLTSLSGSESGRSSASSPLLKPRVADAASRLPMNILLARLASGFAIKTRLGIRSYPQQQSPDQQQTRHQQQPLTLLPLSNALRNCLLKGFYVQSSRASGITLVPSSILPWHVQSIVLESGDSFTSSSSSSKEDNSMALFSQDPFTATWGTLGMSQRLSQSFAWVRASCATCSPLALVSSSASSQLRHFSVSVAQDQFVFSTSSNTASPAETAASSSTPQTLPDQLTFSTEIFLTDSHGILVRDRNRISVFASAGSDARCSSDMMGTTTNSSSHQQEAIDDLWCVSCDAFVGERESTEDDDFSARGANSDSAPIKIPQDMVTIINATSVANGGAGRWTPFPGSAAAGDAVRAKVEFTIPLIPAEDVRSRYQDQVGTFGGNNKQGPFSFTRGSFTVRVQCGVNLVPNDVTTSASSSATAQQATSSYETTSIFHLHTIGDYECSNLQSASDVASSLSSLDAEALDALVRSVAEDTSSVPLAAALSPPLVQVFLPSALAAESELAYDSVRNDGTSTVPGGYIINSQQQQQSSNQQYDTNSHLRTSYDPRVGIPWFPDNGLTSWVLIPRTSYLNIPLGIMTSMAFGTSYAVTRRLVLALKRPVCSSSVAKLETAMSDWVYVLANNLTRTMTHSTVLGQGNPATYTATSTVSGGGGRGGDAASGGSDGDAILSQEDVAPRQSSFTLQQAATGARQMTTWTSCYGGGVDTLEFVQLQCCQNNAGFQLLLQENTPRQQRDLFYRTQAAAIRNSQNQNNNLLSAVNALWNMAVDQTFVGSLGETETRCGVYVLGTLGPVMVTGAGVGGVIAAIALCFYIWMLLSSSTTEMKTWAEMTSIEQWRVAILHMIAPWIPGAHAYYNFGSTTLTSRIVFWVDMGFFFFWYFGVIVHALGRLYAGAGKTKSLAFRGTRFIYVLALTLLLAYSHFLIVNAFLWIAASLHINLALVPYVVGYAVMAIQMWFSVQFMASELEPSLVTGRYPTVTMAPVDAALSCMYFVIIVTVFMGFVGEVEGLTPFMGIAAAFVVFLLLLLYNFAPSESIRLALQSQLEGQNADGENNGSKITDLLHAIMGNQNIQQDDDEDDDDDDDFYFEHDEGSGGSGDFDENHEHFHPAAHHHPHQQHHHNHHGKGRRHNKNPHTPTNDDEEMEEMLNNNETPLLQQEHQQSKNNFNRKRNLSQQPQQQQQGGIDPELAAKLITTVPKLVALANNNGAAGGRGGGAAGNLNANDLQNAMKLVGALQQVGGGGASGNSNPNLAALNAAAALASSASGGGNNVKRGGQGGGNRNNAAATAKTQEQQNQDAIAAGLNVASSLASNYGKGGESNTTALNAEDLTTLLQAMNAVQQDPGAAALSAAGAALAANNNNNTNTSNQLLVGNGSFGSSHQSSPRSPRSMGSGNSPGRHSHNNRRNINVASGGGGASFNNGNINTPTSSSSPNQQQALMDSFFLPQSNNNASFSGNNTNDPSTPMLTVPPLQQQQQRSRGMSRRNPSGGVRNASLTNNSSFVANQSFVADGGDLEGLI